VHCGVPAALARKSGFDAEVAMGGEKPRSEVESALDEHVALPALQALEDAGCNREELVGALGLSFLVNESWKGLVDMDLRGFKRAIKHIRDCADTIEQLNRSELIYRLSVEHRDAGFVGLHESPTLPERLRKYANLLDHRRQLFGPKRNFRGHAWKAWIVAIVTEDTGSPHDREVASIIGAILAPQKYPEKAHQAWRLKHQDFIEMMASKLKEQRFERGIPSRVAPL
jgi:hypothetical protein